MAEYFAPIQGFSLLDENGNRQYYKYDYNALANIPKREQLKLPLQPFLLINRSLNNLNFRIINKPENKSLAIYAFRGERDNSSRLKWVHPVNGQRYIDLNNKSAFDEKYGDLLWATSDVTPSRSLGFGSGLLYDAHGSLLSPTILLPQINTLASSNKLIKDGFINTEFPLSSDSNTYTLRLSSWLFPAIKPSYFDLPLILRTKWTGVNTEEDLTFHYSFIADMKDTLDFDKYLNNKISSNTTDFFFAFSTTEDIENHFLLDEYQSINYDQLEIGPNGYVDQEMLRIMAESFKTRLKNYVSSCLENKLGSMSDQENLFMADNLNTAIDTKMMVPRENASVNKLIHLYFLNWVNFGLIGSQITDRHLSNLLFKFALVDTETGDILAFSPQTVVIGTQFDKKIKSNVHHYPTPSYIKSSLQQETVPLELLHVKII